MVEIRGPQHALSERQVFHLTIRNMDFRAYTYQSKELRSHVAVNSQTPAGARRRMHPTRMNSVSRGELTPVAHRIAQKAPATSGGTPRVAS